MATAKRPSLIHEIENFANTYLGKVTKFQGNGLSRSGVLSHLLGRRWKTPGANKVKHFFITYSSKKYAFFRILFDI